MFEDVDLIIPVQTYLNFDVNVVEHAFLIITTNVLSCPTCRIKTEPKTEHNERNNERNKKANKKDVYNWHKIFVLIFKNFENTEEFWKLNVKGN